MPRDDTLVNPMRVTAPLVPDEPLKTSEPAGLPEDPAPAGAAAILERGARTGRLIHSEHIPARSGCPAEPVKIALTNGAGRFEVEVTDSGATQAPPGGSAVPVQGFGLAVIAGLADDVQISETAAGTSIRMSWPSDGGPA